MNLPIQAFSCSTRAIVRSISKPLSQYHRSRVSFPFVYTRRMATVKDSIPHIIRTAEDPRQQGVWSARLSKIEQVNSKIRLLRLSLPKDGVGAFLSCHDMLAGLISRVTVWGPEAAEFMDIKRFSTRVLFRKINRAISHTSKHSLPRLALQTNMTCCFLS